MNLSVIMNLIRFVKAFALLVVFFVIRFPMSVLAGGVGLFCVYDGVSRGVRCHAVVQQSPAIMTVIKTENRNQRRFFPDYVAIGSVGDTVSAVEVPIFRDQFRRLRRGGSLAVHHLPSGKWLNHSELDESLPMYHILGLHFSWHSPAGILMLGGWFGLLPYLSRKQNRQGPRVVRRVGSTLSPPPTAG